MKNQLLSLPVVVVLSAIVSGCAGTAPSAEFKKSISDVARLCDADRAVVKLTTAEGVTMDEVARQRMATVITSKIEEKKKGVQCPAGVKRNYALDAKITRYDEGSKFGRMMLAGLGAMHINGDFGLTDEAKPGESSAEFTVNKSFAWGGVYGASANINDIEPAFAESVAEAIAGRGEKKE